MKRSELHSITAEIQEAGLTDVAVQVGTIIGEPVVAKGDHTPLRIEDWGARRFLKHGFGEDRILKAIQDFLLSCNINLDKVSEDKLRQCASALLKARNTMRDAPDDAAEDIVKILDLDASSPSDPSGFKSKSKGRPSGSADYLQDKISELITTGIESAR